MSKKYLAHNNSSPTIPLFSFIWTAAALKVFNAPEWLWGVVGLFYLLGAIGALVRIITYEKVEL